MPSEVNIAEDRYIILLKLLVNQNLSQKHGKNIFLFPFHLV